MEDGGLAVKNGGEIGEGDERKVRENEMKREKKFFKNEVG